MRNSKSAIKGATQEGPGPKGVRRYVWEPGPEYKHCLKVLLTDTDLAVLNKLRRNARVQGDTDQLHVLSEAVRYGLEILAMARPVSLPTGFWRRFDSVKLRGQRATRAAMTEDQCRALLGNGGRL